MDLAEDHQIENHANQCGHRSQNPLFPYEYEWICLSCGNNVIKRKHELSKKQRKRINVINRLKHVEHKLFCICIIV